MRVDASPLDDGVGRRERSPMQQGFLVDPYHRPMDPRQPNEGEAEDGNEKGPPTDSAEWGDDTALLRETRVSDTFFSMLHPFG